MSVLSIDVERASRPESLRTAVYVLEVLAAAGIDIADILRAGKFTSLADFKRNAPALADAGVRRVAFHAIDELSRIVRERDGLAAPRHADWQLLVFCLLSCNSLRDAILRMKDFFVAIDGRCGFTSLQVNSSGTAELRFQCLHKTYDTLSLLLDVIGMANIFGLLRWLVADAIPVSTVVLPYGEPCANEWVEFFLPFPIRMGGEYNAMCFPEQYLDHPVMRNGTDYEAHSIDFIADSRGELPTEDLADQARFMMFRTLRRNGTLLSLDALAAQMGRNRDTIRRQLKNAGSSYSSIKDSCRRQLGLNLLRRTDLQIEEIAVRLDFCDSDALRRAVHQWIGMTPSEYRRVGTRL